MKISSAIEYLDENIVCVDCLTGNSDPILSGGMTQTQEAYAQATFNTSAGAASIVIEFLGGFESGFATWAALAYSSDQMLEGINQFRALYEGSYDESKTYGPMRNMAYNAGERAEQLTGGYNIGEIIFNAVGFVMGGSGAIGTIKKLKDDPTVFISAITTAGILEGEWSDFQDLMDALKEVENPNEVYIHVSYVQLESGTDFEDIEIEIGEIEEEYRR